MKICAYVFSETTKKRYKNESFNIRMFAGLHIVVDSLRRNGYTVEYAGSASLHNFDIVLVSITSDCDWWQLLKEKQSWKKGNYVTVVGGAGVLNVRPFLPFVDYFVLGRGEDTILDFVKNYKKYGEYESEHIINAKTFSMDKLYYLKQADKCYPHELLLESGKKYKEQNLGCNHKCLFCGYSWHRKNISKEFKWDWVWEGSEDRERAIIDLDKGLDINFSLLRTTAIDGLSERLRFMVNKKITRDMLKRFLVKLGTCEKPHQVRLFNIIGLPTETEEDYFEFLEDLREVDSKYPKRHTPTMLLLSSTPFKALPLTPMACSPMSYKNYRGVVSNALGKHLKGGRFYDGNLFLAIDAHTTQGLSSIVKCAIMVRGTEKDSENILKIACSSKFENSSDDVKVLTMERYFDVKTLFGEFTKDTLPTRNLRTFAKVENTWK